MTAEEIANGIGNLVTRYADNEKRIALLETRLRDHRRDLSLLEGALEYAKSIQLQDRPALKPYQSAKVVSIDGGELWDTLEEYQQALREKAALEESMEKAGLGILRRKQK